MPPEYWVRAELSPGKWGEVELKGKEIDQYNKKGKRGLNAIVKKAVKRYNKERGGGGSFGLGGNTPYGKLF